MVKSAEVVIIGAGVIGLSIAAHLAMRGIRPIVLERDHICSGTTGQSGGVLRQLYSNPKTALIARDALGTFRTWSDHYVGDPGFNQVGVMFTAGPETESGLRANVGHLLQLGLDMAIIDASEASAIDSRFAFADCTAICYEPNSGLADPVATTHAFAATALSLGADIREQTAVTGITTSGGTVMGVQTNSGPLPADIVVDAAGAWGSALLTPLGHSLPIFFTRHPMALIKRGGGSTGFHPVVLDIHTDSYFIPRGDMTLVGKLGTMPQDTNVDPDQYERGVTNSEIERYRLAARHRMPALDAGAIWGGWAGIYDESVDAHPIVDAVPGADGLFCALGMSGNCFKIAPEIGRRLADRIIDGEAAADPLELFRFDRFAIGQAHERSFGSLSVLA
jgi:sarcosine oxidase subunit beta